MVSGVPEDSSSARGIGGLLGRPNDIAEWAVPEKLRSVQNSNASGSV
jgi:hypothetical protein